jgi:hypothetical protein
MVKPFYYIVGCVALHFLIGWVGSVLLTLLVAGLVFEELVPLKAGLVGFFIHVFLMVVTSVTYPESVSIMIVLVDRYILDFLPISIPIISALIPAIGYALAGYASEYGLRAYYRFSDRNHQKSHGRSWNQSF